MFRIFQDGFSLIELLIVMALVSTVLAFIIPSYNTLISNTEDNIMTSQLLRAIHLAQTEAMMRQELITFKKLSGGWEQGYEISIDDKTLHRFLNPKHKGQWHWRAFPVHREDLQFLRTGVSRSENGTFWYCQKNNSKPRWAVILNQAGRARVVYPNKEGKIENIHPLIC